MDGLIRWDVHKAYAIKYFEDFSTLVAAEVGSSLNPFLLAVNCS
ncbi:hypothetical protein [Viridibacillus arvi]